MHRNDFESGCVDTNIRYIFDLLPHNLPAEAPRMQVPVAAVAGSCCETCKKKDRKSL